MAGRGAISVPAVGADEAAAGDLHGRLPGGTPRGAGSGRLPLGDAEAEPLAVPRAAAAAVGLVPAAAAVAEGPRRDRPDAGYRALHDVRGHRPEDVRRRRAAAPGGQRAGYVQAVRL